MPTRSLNELNYFRDIKCKLPHNQVTHTWNSFTANWFTRKRRSFQFEQDSNLHNWKELKRLVWHEFFVCFFFDAVRQIDRFGASAEQEKWKPVADELKETCQVIRRPPVTVFPPFVRYSLLQVIFLNCFSRKYSNWIESSSVKWQNCTPIFHWPPTNSKNK